jgi:DNA-binding response OmpR family regulator
MKILVIDDTEPLRLLLAQFFRTLGHEVVTLAGRGELSSALEAHVFDAVFTDVAMPDGSGWEVLAGVREARPGVPVVLMTGWSDGQQGPDGLVPDAMLTKPFGLEQVRAALDDVIRR